MQHDGYDPNMGGKVIFGYGGLFRFRFSFGLYHG